VNVRISWINGFKIGAICDFHLGVNVGFLLPCFLGLGFLFYFCKLLKKLIVDVFSRRYEN
jgi:hypothetical protein